MDTETGIQALKRLQKADGRSPRKLSLQAELSANTVGKWLRGTSPQPDNLRQVARLFGLKGPELLRAYGEVEQAESLNEELDHAEELSRYTGVQRRPANLRDDLAPVIADAVNQAVDRVLREVDRLLERK